MMHKCGAFVQAAGRGPAGRMMKQSIPIGEKMPFFSPPVNRIPGCNVSPVKVQNGSPKFGNRNSPLVENNSSPNHKDWKK